MGPATCYRLAFLFLVLAAACFGDNDLEGSTGPDAPKVVEIRAPADVDVGDDVDVVVEVVGEANDQLSVVVTGDLGTFAPESKIVLTGDAGHATFVTRYTAGSHAGLETIRTNVANLAGDRSTAEAALRIYDLLRIGRPVSIGTLATEQASYLIAMPVDVAAPVMLRALGVVAPAVANTVLGLYASDATGEPRTLLARHAGTLSIGANELRVAPRALAVGKYWLVVIYEGTPQIYKSDTTTDTYAGRNLTAYAFGSGLPDTLPTLTMSQIGARNLYLLARP